MSDRTIEHGTDSGYRNHYRWKVPFDGCDCRAASNEYNAQRRAELDIKHTRCSKCGKQSEIPASRDSMCGKCWTGRIDNEKHTSPATLTDKGRWVRSGLTQVWEWAS